jgi:glutamate carboxypeptidase
MDAGPGGDAVTQPVERLAAAVARVLDGHLATLETITAIPSHASVVGGAERVAAVLLPLLERLGFSIEEHPQVPLPEGMEWVARIMTPGMEQADLAPTWSLRRRGDGGPVLLLGDLDTAFPEPAHRRFPLRWEGTRLYGPGIADMKGGLVTMLAALEALEATGLSCPEVRIVLSSDEQAGSLGSSSVVRSAATGCPWTLCLECARRGGMLMAARGHIGIGELVATGREAHAGSAYEDGVNALDLLARVIPPVNAISDPERGVLVTVTMADAGVRRSVIPGRATAVLDVRTPSPDAWEATVAALAATVAEHGNGRVDVRTFSHRPGVPWTEDTDRLLDLVRAEASVLGFEPDAFASPAAGSSAFAAAAGSVVLDGMGPLGGGLMTPDEHVDTASIVPRAAVLAATLHRLEALR